MGPGAVPGRQVGSSGRALRTRSWPWGRGRSDRVQRQSCDLVEGRGRMPDPAGCAGARLQALEGSAARGKGFTPRAWGAPSTLRLEAGPAGSQRPQATRVCRCRWPEEGAGATGGCASAEGTVSWNPRPPACPPSPRGLGRTPREGMEGRKDPAPAAPGSSLLGTLPSQNRRHFLKQAPAHTGKPAALSPSRPGCSGPIPLGFEFPGRGWSWELTSAGQWGAGVIITPRRGHSRRARLRQVGTRSTAHPRLPACLPAFRISIVPQSTTPPSVCLQDLAPGLHIHLFPIWYRDHPRFARFKGRHAEE